MSICYNNLKSETRFIFFTIFFFFPEGIAIQPSASVGSVVGTPDGRHVEHTGEVQVASVFGGDVTNRRARRLHTGRPGTSGRHARQIQVSSRNRFWRITVSKLFHKIYFIDSFIL